MDRKKWPLASQFQDRLVAPGTTWLPPLFCSQSLVPVCIPRNGAVVAAGSLAPAFLPAAASALFLTKGEPTVVSLVASFFPG